MTSPRMTSHKQQNFMTFWFSYIKLTHGKIFRTLFRYSKSLDMINYTLHLIRINEKVCMNCPSNTSQEERLWKSRKHFFKYYYYYTTFNGLFSRTTWVSWHQKGKTSLDLNEARDDGVLGCSAISWTICKQSAPHSRQITTPTPSHSIFTGWMLFPMPNRVKALKAQLFKNNTKIR